MYVFTIHPLPQTARTRKWHLSLSPYSTHLTVLNNALNTYMPALETGTVGVDGVDSTLQQLNEALYAAGLQEVIDEKQRQLDEWLAENGATQTPAENQELIDSAGSGSDASTDETSADASAETTATTADTTAEAAAETTAESVAETAAESE